MLTVTALAMAQAVAAAAPVQGITVYQPDFFAQAQPANAEEMLARIPGFTLDGGNFGRGFEGGGGNVLVNGQRPATKSDSLEEVLRRIPAGQVARIELIRGGAPGIDMQGKTVVANVIRRGGAGISGLAQLTHQQTGFGRTAPSGRLELTGRIGERAWEASARWGKTLDDEAGHGPQIRLDADDRPVFRSDFTSTGDVVARVLTGAYEQPLAGGRLRLNGRIARETATFEERNRVVIPATDLRTTRDRSLSDTTEIGGRFFRDLGSRTTLELIGLRQDGARDSKSVSSAAGGDSAFSLERDLTETIYRAVLRRRQSDRLSFEAGGEAAINTLHSETALTENGAPIPLPSADIQIEERRSETFGKVVWSPLAPVTLEAGLRYEASTIESGGPNPLRKELRFAKPQITAAWTINPPTQLRLRFERTVGQLNFNDFVASSSLNTGVVHAGNPRLSPEQAWVSEITLDRQFGADGQASLTLRRSLLRDVIDRAPVISPDGQIFDARSNIGSGRKDQVIANLTLPLSRLGLAGAQLKLDADWRFTRVTDPTTGERRPISEVSPLRWNASYIQDLPQWRTTLGATAAGGWRDRFYRLSEITTAKKRTLVVVYAEHRPRPDITLRAEVANATSRGLRHTRDIYAGPRDRHTLAFVDDRHLQVGPLYAVSARKTF